MNNGEEKQKWNANGTVIEEKEIVYVLTHLTLAKSAGALRNLFRLTLKCGSTQMWLFEPNRTRILEVTYLPVVPI